MYFASGLANYRYPVYVAMLCAIAISFFRCLLIEKSKRFELEHSDHIISNWIPQSTDIYRISINYRFL